MSLALSATDLAFRDEVRAFIDETFTPDLRAAASRQAGVWSEYDLGQAWHRILYAKGWIAPNWPKQYGGTGWSPVQRYIWDTECGDAGTPQLSAMALQMCGPVLIGHGTKAQQDYHLPRILSGENYWCQGYSEPQAGSDLASLQCKAVREGDQYVVNGTKLWTTHAHNANWMFLLVRTDPMAKPQAGITFLLTPMNAPGISVRPIISMSGEHEVNQVFFDSVRIPVENRVGEENQGWTVAKYLLEFERGGGSQAARIRRVFKTVKIILNSERSDAGGALILDPDIARKLAEIEVALAALSTTERNVISALSTGGNVGDATASMLKLRGSETMQKVSELAIEALGTYAAPYQQAALGMHPTAKVVGPDYAVMPTAKYLNSRAATVYGGSAEVQRNILSRSALGL